MYKARSFFNYKSVADRFARSRVSDLDKFPRILQIASKGEQRICENGPEILILSRLDTRSKAISIDRVGKQYAGEDRRGLQIIAA